MFLFQGEVEVYERELTIAITDGKQRHGTCYHCSGVADITGWPFAVDDWTTRLY